MLLSITLIAQDTFSQQRFLATDFNNCDLNPKGKVTCLGYLTLKYEQVYITKYEDSITLTSKVDFLQSTFYLADGDRDYFYDKSYESYMYRFIALDEFNEIRVIYLSKTPIKSLRNKHLFIVKKGTSATIYLLDKL
jgi:hypothetical protein